MIDGMNDSSSWLHRRYIQSSAQIVNRLVSVCLLAAFSGSIFTSSGCLSTSENEVVVYCALDREFSETILKEFETASNIKVLPKFDQESNKTVGLANEIIQQRDRQRCDVFWNNEILHTLRLKQAGLLAVYDCPTKAGYPSQFYSADSDWYGFAARARVFLINTELLKDREQWPDSIQDLIAPQWKANCGIAKPLFGTTATHAAVLYDQWGQEKADQFFEKIAKNTNVESGNKQVAVKVARGEYAFGLTDTDDAIIEVEQGNPVAIVFPDQGAESMGTLFIPNTLCILKDGPNLDNSKRLVEFLLSTSVEQSLAKGRSAQIPLNRNSTQKSRVEPENLRFMQVDFESAARNWDRSRERLRTIFGL